MTSTDLPAVVRADISLSDEDFRPVVRGVQSEALIQQRPSPAETMMSLCFRLCPTTWTPVTSADTRSKFVAAWMLVLVISWSLLSGCSSRRESAFSQPPAPDLAVTTLESSDIESVARVMQLQGTILMGCDLAVQKPLPTRLSRLVDSVRDQYQSRARDLDALVRLKNAPSPENLGQQNTILIDKLTHADPLGWDSVVVTFLHETHTHAMRLLRNMADRAKDPDVRDFATRQLAGVVATLRDLDHRSEVEP